MAEVYKVPLVLSPQPEGGYTVTSPVVPELLTEGDTVEEALEHVRDALKAVLEIYEDIGRPLQISSSMRRPTPSGSSILSLPHEVAGSGP